MKGLKLLIVAASAAAAFAVGLAAQANGPLRADASGGALAWVR